MASNGKTGGESPDGAQSNFNNMQSEKRLLAAHFTAA
jgi:hypothetical protein